MKVMKLLMSGVMLLGLSTQASAELFTTRKTPEAAMILTSAPTWLPFVATTMEQSRCGLCHDYAVNLKQDSINYLMGGAKSELLNQALELALAHDDAQGLSESQIVSEFAKIEIN